MKERKGPIGRATDLAGGVAATMRRMARDREPRVLVYDHAGLSRLLQPSARGHERALEVSERLIAVVDDGGTIPQAGADLP